MTNNLLTDFAHITSLITDINNRVVLLANTQQELFLQACRGRSVREVTGTSPHWASADYFVVSSTQKNPATISVEAWANGGCHEADWHIDRFQLDAHIIAGDNALYYEKVRKYIIDSDNSQLADEVNKRTVRIEALEAELTALKYKQEI